MPFNDRAGPGGGTAEKERAGSPALRGRTGDTVFAVVVGLLWGPVVLFLWLVAMLATNLVLGGEHGIMGDGQDPPTIGLALVLLALTAALVARGMRAAGVARAAAVVSIGLAVSLADLTALLLLDPSDPVVPWALCLLFAPLLLAAGVRRAARGGSLRPLVAIGVVALVAHVCAAWAWDVWREHTGALAEFDAVPVIGVLDGDAWEPVYTTVHGLGDFEVYYEHSEPGSQDISVVTYRDDGEGVEDACREPHTYCERRGDAVLLEKDWDREPAPSASGEDTDPWTRVEEPTNALVQYDEAHVRISAPRGTFSGEELADLAERVRPATQAERTEFRERVPE
ncbi:hypothetical protein HDA32_004532 [Spinactinospora alkalitolerans]|uniref:Uncharacterized protein n=1 Tax=Spinactinospora alkalitolerans TaxID=687207 RepID=A0A852U202_9ACTN|nr:hypothetical protein [Spinactinospora alkalitolerans]NYE49412.1 hypothetical protein [Spinactinospora alkalitolerans]